MAFENSLSSFPSLSREDEDLLEQDYHRASPVIVPETPIVDLMMDDEKASLTAGSQGEQRSRQLHECMSYKASYR